MNLLDHNGIIPGKAEWGQRSFRINSIFVIKPQGYAYFYNLNVCGG